MKPEKKGSHSTLGTIPVSGDDYRQYLLDLKGDGDDRHLIVNEWFGGNNPYCHEAWVLDVKDGFRCIGNVPGGEGIIYPAKNPELIFTLDKDIAVFSCGLYVVASQKIRLNREGKRLYVLDRQAPLPLAYYRKMLNDPDIPNEVRRDYLFYQLCADLAQCGHLREYHKIAKLLGYSDEYFDKQSPVALYNIVLCRFWPAYCRVNRFTNEEIREYERTTKNIQKGKK